MAEQTAKFTISADARQFTSELAVGLRRSVLRSKLGNRNTSNRSIGELHGATNDGVGFQFACGLFDHDIA